MKKSALSALIITMFFVMLCNLSFAAGIGATKSAFVPVSLSQTRDLHFGEFYVTDGAAASVTIDSAGVRTASANVLLSTTGQLGFTGQFTVNGIAFQSYILTEGSNTVTDGTTVLTVDNMTFSNGGSGILNSSGADTFDVGARLNITSGATNGAYSSGSLNITVSYQ